ncbi:kinase-like protein [Cadophora sp. DSE1049]|nr:kinase-like protein [Cadophora sp. DSE1049]
MDHPNIVRILKAFSDEKDHVVVYNFIFPLAIGNLKELFLADLGKETSVSKLVSTLWLQFEGLGSGVSHLHENGIAHRDIKPSNVLLYQDSSPSRLTAKIADFGLAVGTQDNPKFEVGSVDAKSALKYADPEMRTRSSGPETSQNPPTREELWKADIWTLGAVYTEMLSYLVRGPTGVTEFRNFITTTKNNLTSDQISDSMYDDGIKVKAQVLEWLNTLANWENRAGEIVPLIQSMLNESSKRPTASIVVERLSNVIRLVRFTPWTHVPKPGYTDSWKVRLEEKLGAPIDWKPFASVKRACSPGMTRVLWEWYDEWLEMDLPQDKAEQYRKSCKPLSQITAQDRGHPVESFDGSGSTIAPEHPNAPTSTQGDLSSASSSTTGPSSQALPLSRGAVPGTNHFREIYWCVDIPWSERRVTYLMALKVDGLSGNGEDGRICDDMTLCKVLLQSYNKIRGFRGTLLSWKTCVDLRFIKFARIYTDSAEVSGLKVELPPSKDYDYELISPDEVHMNIASKQILRGFSKREWGYHLTTTLSLIPKKKDSTLNFNMGSQGWGLHAIEGFSLTKILIWVAVLNGVGIAFVVLWLVFVSKTDLQNAFVPVTYFMTVILLGLAVPQLLGAA